jgi:hypothetical protein
MHRSIRDLLFILPALGFIGAVAPPALGLELDASSVASQMARALERGHLSDAQELVSQMARCGVDALRVDGADYPVSKLGADITKLAKGEAVNTLPEPLSFATFLLDASARTAVSCTIAESTNIATAVALSPQAAAEPPAAGAPPAADAPPAVDPYAELCAALENSPIPCFNGHPPAVPPGLTPEGLCEALGVDPCPYPGSAPAADQALSAAVCEEAREETGVIPPGCDSFLSGSLPANAAPAAEPLLPTPQSDGSSTAPGFLSSTPDLVDGGVVGGLLN